jgi:hypothetical protein
MINSVFNVVLFLSVSPDFAVRDRSSQVVQAIEPYRSEESKFGRCDEINDILLALKQIPQNLYSSKRP